MEIKSEIFFASEKLKNNFKELEEGKSEEKELFKWLENAFKDLQENAFCGVQIPKRLMPKEYQRYDIDNLWKYDLQKGWRLLYSVTKEGIQIISLILEWINHKNYERRFNY